jgi:hypothetical protein
MCEALEDRRLLAAGFFQGFEVDAAGWDVFGGTFDATRVASGTDGIPSQAGAFHGKAPGSSGTPDFSSAVTNWGGYSDNPGCAFDACAAGVFPAQGYTTSADVFLDLTATASNDTRFDFSSAINQPDGTHRRDFVFNAGFYTSSDVIGPGAGQDRFVISASNVAFRDNSFPKNPLRDPIAITSSGWYTFQHRFYDSGGGVLAVDLSIAVSGGAAVNTWTLSDPTDIIGSTVGGNRYGWFANNEFPFLAIDNTFQDNPGGVTPAPEFLVNDSTNGFQVTYAETRNVAGNAAGDLMIAYAGSGPGDTQGIFARRFDATNT